MRKYLTTQNIISAVASLLILISVILVLVSNAVPALSLGNLALPLISLLLCLAALIVGIVLSPVLGGQHYVIVLLHLAAIAFAMLAFGNLISQRAILASAQLTWDKGNSSGWSALITSFVAVFFSLVSAVLVTVAAFLPDKGNKSN